MNWSDFGRRVFGFSRRITTRVFPSA